jgi:hypothetical protein
MIILPQKLEYITSVSISMNFTNDAQFVTSLSGYLNNTFFICMLNVSLNTFLRVVKSAAYKKRAQVRVKKPSRAADFSSFFFSIHGLAGVLSDDATQVLAFCDLLTVICYLVFAVGHSFEPIVTMERNERCSPLIVRVFPVTVNLALDRMSFELLPTLTSTGPGSMTKSPEIPV